MAIVVQQVIDKIIWKFSDAAGSHRKRQADMCRNANCEGFQSRLMLQPCPGFGPFASQFIPDNDVRLFGVVQECKIGCNGWMKLVSWPREHEKLILPQVQG